MQTTKLPIRLRVPAHARSLISTFVVGCLDSIIPLVSVSKISSLYLHVASVAVQAGLSLPWSQTPKTGFLMMWLILGSIEHFSGVRNFRIFMVPFIFQ